MKLGQPEMRKLIIVFAALSVAAYFLTTYYLKVTYVGRAPKQGAFLLFPPYSETRHLWAAHAWLPEEISKVEVYEDGNSLGFAEAVYDSPDKALAAGGRQWKFIEFGSANNPNTSGHSYWAVKPDLPESSK